MSSEQASADRPADRPLETDAARATRLQGEVGVLQRRLQEKAEELQRRIDAEAGYQARQAADIAAWRAEHQAQLAELRKQLANAEAKLTSDAGVAALLAELGHLNAMLREWAPPLESEFRAQRLLKPKQELAKLSAVELLTLLLGWLSNRTEELSRKQQKLTETAVARETQAGQLREAVSARDAAVEAANKANTDRDRQVAAASGRATEATSRANSLQAALDAERSDRVRLQDRISLLEEEATRRAAEHRKTLNELQQRLDDAVSAKDSALRGLDAANRTLQTKTREAALVPGLSLQISDLTTTNGAQRRELEKMSEEVRRALEARGAAVAAEQAAIKAAAAFQAQIQTLEQGAIAATGELPHESELRELLSGAGATAARLLEILTAWASDSWKYARAGQTLMVMQDGPKILNHCFAAMYAAYQAKQSSQLLSAEQQALLELTTPLINFVVYAIRESSHHAGFFLRLGEDARAWLVGSLDDTTARYLAGITLTDPAAHSLVHFDLIQRVTPTLPATTRANLIVVRPPEERAKLFFGHPALKAAVVALDAAVQTQCPNVFSERDPQGLRARRALLSGGAGADLAAYQAARSAMDVLYYLPESVCRQLLLGVCRGTPELDAATQAFGFDPLLALLFVDVGREHVTALGRDITHIAPFMAIADLRDPRVAAKGLDAIRELLHQVGAACGDVAARRIVTANIRSQLDTCLGRLSQN